MDALIVAGNAAIRASGHVKSPDRALEQKDGDKTGEMCGTVSFAPEIKARDGWRIEECNVGTCLS
ncbi:MAG: hypothetical protein ABJL67_20790, partial [Sulfitobacter sp.]